MKCPFCNSNQVEKTWLGYVQNTCSGILSVGVGMAAQSILGHRVRTKDIRDAFEYEYKCKKCGQTFYIKD